MNSIIERIDHLATLVRDHANTDLDEVKRYLDELKTHVESLDATVTKAAKKTAATEAK